MSEDELKAMLDTCAAEIADEEASRECRQWARNCKTLLSEIVGLRSCVEADRQLRADRDAAHMKLDGLEAELADFRAAWAILDEPGENLRGAHTAADVAQRFVTKLAEARAADTNGASLDACEARARVLLEEAEQLRTLLDIQKQATAGAQNICVSEQGDRELAEHVARAVVAERDEARATAELHRVALAAAQAQVVALKKALEDALPFLDTDHASGDVPDCLACMRTQTVKALLAQPADDAALRALLMKVAHEIYDTDTPEPPEGVVAAVLKGTP